MTLPTFDHLVFACRDLAVGCQHVEELLGVEARPGGRHEGMGTRNALVSLGADAYLEIVGIDSARPSPKEGRWFGIDRLEAPRLVTWAVRPKSLDALLERARSGGVDLGDVRAGGRRRADGVELRWRVTDPGADRRGGVLPFLMDWRESEHPAISLEPACTLVSLFAEHPEAETVGAELRLLGIDIPVGFGPEPALTATVRSPRGLVELR